MWIVQWIKTKTEIEIHTRVASDVFEEQYFILSMVGFIYILDGSNSSHFYFDLPYMCHQNPLLIINLS